MIEFTTWNA